LESIKGLHMIIASTISAAPLMFHPGIQYGATDDGPLLLDAIYSQGASLNPRPAVLWVHGGGWYEGSRYEGIELGFCTLLAAHGFFSITIDYRLSNDAIFPAQLHDVKAAIRWLRANAAAYHIDPQRIGIWGFSAGGHLAALAALTANMREFEGQSGSAGYSSEVQAVAIGAAPTDFLRPGGELINHTTSPVTHLCGGTVTERADLMRAASPLYHITGTAPPFLIAHGTNDEVVPFEQAERFHAALIRAGTEATLVPIEGGYHDWQTAYDDRPFRPNNVRYWELGPLALPFFQAHLQVTMV